MTAGRKNSDNFKHWCTPPHYVAAIRSFFGGSIGLDPCSNPHSVVGAEKSYALPAVDGLYASWQSETVFVNPPYGADRVRGTSIKQWLEKCMKAHLQFGSEVIALVPVATNTSHWKNFVWGRASAVSFLYDTRLKFIVNGNPDTKGAPMACALIYWGDRVEDFERSFSSFGAIVDLRAQAPFA